ncbi:serine hydrolase [Flavihumibacter petaseus]|uniref:Racemase/peptidase S12 family protein n=1 Tax=Flavihumibacter petaseus NBRC 106054 TaxID=1220578 RepID=A0A0E9N4P9_9BACT|nr:serine hydrolase [Flavihumibacter petaseus]GAO44773.1 racemase/peptidase S12 family protein [Flavihumibacter petaseus NBRC 106054]
MLLIKRTILSALCLYAPGAFAQTSINTLSPLENAIQHERKNFFFVDAKDYAVKDPKLPIGIFDSGTGGLATLNALLTADQYNNSTGMPGSDGVPDFSKEEFIFLADQANMPYGNYSSEKKSDLLVEHVLKDVQFLLSDKYYADAAQHQFNKDKRHIKTVVVACNTATAYGIDYIRSFLDRSGIRLKVIGVIDAGAKGVLDSIRKDEAASVAVFATVGTVASGGYEKAILAMKEKTNHTGQLIVFNQGGYGLAEAVDEEPDFVNRKAVQPAANYRGPSLENATYRIDKTLLDIYNFNFDRNKMLCDSRNTDDCQVLQLNATENYVRYHLVSLLEKMRKSAGAPPLKAIILGCTHYPYLVNEIQQTLKDLYNYQKNGQYIYRPLMAADIRLVDPSVNVARELYGYLASEKLMNPSGNPLQSRFFITVPNTDNKAVITDSLGRFTYAYKYGRSAGNVQEYVKVVPFSRSNIPAETFQRFASMIPAANQLINYDLQRKTIDTAIRIADSMYRAFAQREHAPSVVFGIVKDGRLIHFGGEGFSNLETRRKADSSVAYHIASMSKSFISVAILQLRDEGKLQLDDPVSRYIPEIKGQQFSKDAPELTIRHLLTHAAGFPEDNPWGDRQLGITDSAMLAMFARGISFSTAAGTQYEYSNMGFAMLGYIVSRVSGKTYEAYTQEKIFRPLGMNHTYWEYDDVPADRLAIGYRTVKDKWVKQPMLHSGAYGAMGGLITTLDDFVKYLNFQLAAWPARDDADFGPLKRSSLREMQHAANINTLNASAVADGRSCPVVSAYAYGLRWSKDCKGRIMIGHSGGLPGFGSNWVILPDYGLGLICFSNHTYASASAINQQVADKLLTITGWKPRAIPASAILQQRRQELISLLPAWDTTGKASAFAENFFLDYFVSELKSETADLFAKAGRIIRYGEMEPENNLRGKFLIIGEKATLEVYFTLTPEQPAKIQEYHLREVPVRR